MEEIRSLSPVTVYVVVPNLPKAALIEWQVMARNHLSDINSELCLYMYSYWMNWMNC